MLTDLPGTTSNTPSPETSTADGSDQPSQSTVIKFPKKNKMATAFRGIPEEAQKVYTGITVSPEMEQTTPEEYLDEQRKVLISDLCEVYTKEIFFKLAGLGFKVFTESFDKDLHFVHEALHSALLRSYNTFHPIQEFIDESFELIPLEEFEQVSEIYPENPETDGSKDTT
jgi:hypothetical protein